MVSVSGCNALHARDVGHCQSQKLKGSSCALHNSGRRAPTSIVHSAARRPCNLFLCTAVLESTSAPAGISATSTPEDLRALMFKRGWQRAWVDGISERAAKGELRTSVDTADKVISYLEGLGIPNQLVCNMTALAPKILGMHVEHLQSVVAFMKDQGLTDAELQFVLEKHPKLLLFSQEGSVLAMGRARAQVNKDGAGRVGVQMYREGAFLRGLTTKK